MNIQDAIANLQFALDDIESFYFYYKVEECGCGKWVDDELVKNPNCKTCEPTGFIWREDDHFIQAVTQLGGIAIDICDESYGIPSKVFDALHNKSFHIRVLDIDSQFTKYLVCLPLEIKSS